LKAFKVDLPDFYHTRKPNVSNSTIKALAAWVTSLKTTQIIFDVQSCKCKLAMLCGRITV